ncbi:MAG: class I SAM-dependent methyltransferase [Stigonema ocellatum SAG 48.90 = DSM 106950]|nr:class I SAM-dependent methyltransferase [Stigonema ocellatum SAG 48.90 = DSM 106950]
MNDSLMRRVDDYKNTAEHNDKLHAEFSQLTQSIPFLAQHRKHIETYNLGFGDSAFHYMWYLLVQHLTKYFPQPSLLEIGVFKGQVISLWSLIAAQLALEISVTGISPLKGNPQPKSLWLYRLKAFTNPKFYQDSRSGNFYADEDYYSIISNLFTTFKLNLSDIRIIKGYSNSLPVINSIKNEKFCLIYIDGDHSYKGVVEDLKNYSNLLENNGLLVMDDASYYLPGRTFWKGHKTVSRACEIIPKLGLINILNIGHNRIYKKLNF